MENFVQKGDTIDLTAPSGGVVSGTTYKIGVILCVAANTIAAGLTFPAAVTGVYDLAKATGETWAEGDALYWDNTAKDWTKTSSSNTIGGYAVLANQSADTVGRLRLTPKAG